MHNYLQKSLDGTMHLEYTSQSSSHNIAFYKCQERPIHILHLTETHTHTCISVYKNQQPCLSAAESQMEISFIASYK